MMGKFLFNKKLRIDNCSSRLMYQEWPQGRVGWGKVPRWKALASRKWKKTINPFGNVLRKQQSAYRKFTGCIKKTANSFEIRYL